MSTRSGNVSGRRAPNTAIVAAQTSTSANRSNQSATRTLWSAAAGLPAVFAVALDIGPLDHSLIW